MSVVRNLFEEAKYLRSCLEDEISKEIFSIRFLNNITGMDYSRLLEYTNPYIQSKFNEFEQGFQNIQNDELVVFWGIGFSGKQLLGRIDSNREILLCDIGYKSMKSYNGYPIISPENMLEQIKGRKYKIIVTTLFVEEVLKTLLNNGVPKSDILCAVFSDETEIYFDEVFVDAGCYDGTKAFQFAKNTNFQYKKIIALEPDAINLKRMRENLNFNSLDNVIVIQKGLWDKKETLKFSGNGSSSSNISSKGDIEIQVDSLDSLLNEEVVTFLKMDIEGAELKALQGARNIIQKYKPKLAISMYHKPEDIIEILGFIKELVPEYKLYLRHYSTTIVETVLYAVI